MIWSLIDLSKVSEALLNWWISWYTYIKANWNISVLKPNSNISNYNLFFVDGLDEAQFIQSARGFAQLVDKSGYIYTRHQSKKSRTWWKCVEKTSKANPCNARATTEGFHITKYFKTHTHPPPIWVSRKFSNWIKMSDFCVSFCLISLVSFHQFISIETNKKDFDQIWF